MTKPSTISKTAILHFAAPPAVGGVEEVIRAHAGVFGELDIPAVILAGVGDAEALPNTIRLVKEPLLDTQHPDILAVTDALAEGRMPDAFNAIKDRIKARLRDVLTDCPNLIVHNVLTVHVNFPLTVALHELLDEGAVSCCLAWCHDFTWTMQDYRDKLHDGYPWDLLRTRRDDVSYIVVSDRRRDELADLFQCDRDAIRVIYDGVDAPTLLGLSRQGLDLIRTLEVMASDLVLLMPIRIVKSKNIEFALRIVKEIKAAGVGVKLVVTGPPDPHDRASLQYYAMLRALREELDLVDNVRFVYESGPDPDVPLMIGPRVVGDFFRVCDVILIASHSEGFGMPILEAGLAGRPVFTTDIPAAREIGGQDVMLFSVGDAPATVAGRIVDRVSQDPVQRHKRKVRQQFTWMHIVTRDLLPLLAASASSPQA